MQNEPNFRRDGDRGVEISDLRPGTLPPTHESFVRNKANLATAGFAVTCFCDLTYAWLPRKQTRQNKANWRTRTPRFTRGGLAFVGNALRRHYERGFCAKRTQFADGRICDNVFVQQGLCEIVPRTGGEERSQS